MKMRISYISNFEWGTESGRQLASSAFHNPSRGPHTYSGSSLRKHEFRQNAIEVMRKMYEMVFDES